MFAVFPLSDYNVPYGMQNTMILRVKEKAKLWVWDLDLTFASDPI